MRGLLRELNRRNVFKVAAVYAVVGWLVLQVADVFFPALKLPEWTTTFVAALLVLGFPVALVFAWAFELTPEGLKRTEDVDPAQSVTAVTSRKLNFMIIGLLALAVVYFAINHDWRGDEQTTRPDTEAGTSVAVLPFVNMSDDPSNEYFSDGITEELLGRLVKVDDLRVVSRTSSFAFKNQNVDIPTIADALDVNHVVEGSVRKVGNRVRITAQLIDVESDSHLWSENYDRELEDIFSIQEEIARSIAGALQLALGTDETFVSRPTDNIDAYQHYLRGRHAWQRRGEQNIREAIESFQKAIQLDPGFGRAFSSLAAAYVTLPVYSFDAVSSTHPLAEAAVLRALELDSDIAEAHAVLADLTRLEYRWSDAEQHYQDAIAIEPGNSTAHLWYAEFLVDVGRVKDAVGEAEIAYRLDPLSTGANAVLAGTYYTIGDKQKALPAARHAAELNHPFAFLVESILQAQRGEIEQAIASREQYARLVGTDPADARPVIEAIADRSKLPLALDALSQARERGPLDLPALYSDYGSLGRSDEAFEILDIATRRSDSSGDVAVSVGPTTLGVSLWADDLGNLRRDARFEQIVERLGLVSYWREHGWPDRCRPVGDDFECF